MSTLNKSRSRKEQQEMAKVEALDKSQNNIKNKTPSGAMRKSPRYRNW